LAAKQAKYDMDNRALEDKENEIIQRENDVTNLENSIGEKVAAQQVAADQLKTEQEKWAKDKIKMGSSFIVQQIGDLFNYLDSMDDRIIVAQPKAVIDTAADKVVALAKTIGIKLTRHSKHNKPEINYSDADKATIAYLNRCRQSWSIALGRAQDNKDAIGVNRACSMIDSCEASLEQIEDSYLINGKLIEVEGKVL